MAAVRLEDSAFADPRVWLVGEMCGYNHYEALGRLAHLWRHCTERQSYVVREPVIDMILGKGGGVALVTAELGDRTDEGIRVRGTEGRIEWLGKLRANAKAGGEASKRRPRGPDGAFARTDDPLSPHGGAFAKPDTSQMAGQSPAISQPNPSPLTLTLTPALVRSDLRDVETPRRAKKSHHATPAELAVVRVVLDKLGNANGVRYTASASHTRLIAARLREGLSECDLRMVVSYCADRLGWTSKPEMQEYLRPETLFGPQTIGKYLDPARSWFAALGPAYALTPEAATT